MLIYLDGTTTTETSRQGFQGRVVDSKYKADYQLVAEGRTQATMHHSRSEMGYPSTHGRVYRQGTKILFVYVFILAFNTCYVI